MLGWRISNINEFMRAYPVWCAWNKHHTFRNFIKVYRNTFAHFRFGQGPIWRIYKIIKNTLNGNYRQIEKEFAEDYKKLLTHQQNGDII